MTERYLYITDIKSVESNVKYLYNKVFSFSNGYKLILDHNSNVRSYEQETPKWMCIAFKYLDDKLDESYISDRFFFKSGYTPLFIADIETEPDNNEYRFVEFCNGYKLKVKKKGNPLPEPCEGTPMWMVRLFNKSTDVLRYGNVGNVHYVKNNPLLDYWYD